MADPYSRSGGDIVIFRETPLSGAYLIEMDPIRDGRGFFARTYCRETFAAKGLNPHIEQCNLSYNRRRGTIRGMHFQREPYAEAKLVHCIRGAIYDAIIDLRPQSATYKRWFAVTLTGYDRIMLYVPEGFAHGFQTLQDHTEVMYQMSRAYHPEASAGIRWNDAQFQIEWPLECTVISGRDRSYPEYAP
nr:dTDP-4-dehydrorhamnose 3,5-epimerase [Paenibacillus sp. MSJ-34]